MLRFEHERAALVEVYATCAGCAVAILERDRALEDISVLCVVTPRRLRARDAEHVAQLGQEQLIVRPLRRLRCLPARDETFDVSL